MGRVESCCCCFDDGEEEEKLSSTSSVPAPPPTSKTATPPSAKPTARSCEGAAAAWRSSESGEGAEREGSSSPLPLEAAGGLRSSLAGGFPPSLPFPSASVPFSAFFFFFFFCAFIGGRKATAVTPERVQALQTGSALSATGSQSAIAPLPPPTPPPLPPPPEEDDDDDETAAPPEELEEAEEAVDEDELDEIVLP